MDKLIHFFRVVKPNYNWFRLIHYLSIKSFSVNYPDWTIVLHFDKFPFDSNWFTQLMSECNNIELSKLKVYKDKVDKFDCIQHYIDQISAETLYLKGGLVSDLDMICLSKLDNFDDSKVNIESELDYFDKYTIGLGIGFMYASRENPTICEYLKYRDNYEKGSGWTKYSVDLMYDIYKSNPDKFNLIAQKVVDPFGPQYPELQDLFLHNHEIPAISKFLHVSESVSWDEYLKHLTVEHIMTVNTTFTKAVRKYISNQYWDSKSLRSSILLY